jgi:hypothetical protein
MPRAISCSMGKPIERADDVHQASTIAHTPGDRRRTYRPSIRSISRRSLPQLDRVAAPFAAGTRLIIVRSVVRIHPELLQFQSGMRRLAVVGTCRAAINLS